MHNSKFIQDFMVRYNYPEEAVKLFTDVLDALDKDKAFGKAFDLIKERFDYHQTRIDDKILIPLGLLGGIKGYSKYTMHFVFLLSLTQELKYQYTLLGINEDVYWQTMDDLRCKLLECIECKGMPGTFVASWFDGFFRLDRVAYGRFQYEVNTFDKDEPFTMSCGHTVNPGDIYINFHIPSSGIPLTDEVRFDSYKKAYEHVKNMFDGKNVIFGCGSWLLFPKHKDFLPERLNILKFLNDFEIVESHESDRFGDIWRVFGKDADLPYEKLPTDTSLKKAYAEWLRAGNKTGSGFGLFMFDGEKIVR